MAITKLTGRTYDMMIKDDRVKEVISHPDDPTKIVVSLADPWTSGVDGEKVLKSFDNWESARNWMRKARITE